MIDSNFEVKKLIKLIAQVFFYSVLSVIVFYGFGISEFSIKVFIKSLLPITYGMYWFASTYVVMYIFTPFINPFIKSLTKKNHLNLILILVILWSIIPTFTAGSMNYSNLGWFITLYIIASYIKLYPSKHFKKCKFNMILALLTYGIVILSVIAFDILGLKINIFAIHATYFMGLNMLPILICSITLFLGFINLKIDSNKVINRIAMSMFGVYLIHDNALVRPFLWQEVFQNRMYIDSPILILHAIITIILVFSVSVIIDQLRLYLIERPLFLFFDSRQYTIDLYVNSCKDRILTLVIRLNNYLDKK